MHQPTKSPNMRIIINFLFAIISANIATTTLGNPANNDSVVDDSQWTIYKQLYNKSYESIEQEYFRRSVFFDNLRNITKHNKKYDSNLVSYKLKINRFGDMLADEYQISMTPANVTIETSKPLRYKVFYRPYRLTTPVAFDWRIRGAVTPVRDQGLSCGACWAFGAVGALEGQYFKKTGNLTVLSVQEILDCTQAYGNLGCLGGSPALAFEYARNQKNIKSETEYPYVNRTNSCLYSLSDDDGDENAKSFIVVYPQDEVALEAAVVSIGPMSVGINGFHDTFRFYSEGVYYQPDCIGKEDMNHALLIVGYGTDAKHGDYWLVKNSWGKSWGREGYAKIARNRSNHCNIATAAVCPIV